jgi:hypothetical protein
MDSTLNTAHILSAMSVVKSSLVENVTAECVSLRLISRLNSYNKLKSSLSSEDVSGGSFSFLW